MKVGIVGCGLISRAHIDALRRAQGVEIVAVCDSDPMKADRTAGAHGIPHSYRDLSSLLSERRPDVIHVLTPPRSHRELAIAALEARCHVLVEKPMAIDPCEADLMVTTARRLGLTLSVCHNLLFDPAMIEARALVARGAIGKIVAVDIFWGYFHGWMDRLRADHWMHELPGGYLQEVAPHPVYLLQEFLPDSRLVSATARNGDRAGLGLLFAGRSGPGVIALSLSAKPYRRFVTLHGTEMSIGADLTNSTLVRFRQGRPGSERQSLDHGLQLVWSGLRKAVRKRVDRPSGELAISHRRFIEAFYRCLRDGTTPPVTGAAGHAVVATLDRIWNPL